MNDYVSLEVAQKLQKVGYKSICSKKYCIFANDGRPERAPILISSDATEIYDDGQYYIMAPTVTELLNELPFALLRDGEGVYNLEIYPLFDKDERDWYVQYVYEEDRQEILHEETSENLSDALGLMVIYLMENNLLTK